MSTPPPSLHPIVDRLAALRADSLTVEDVAEVLRLGARAARRLLINGEIGHIQRSIGVNVLDGSHEPKNYRRETTPGDVLVYLIRTTAGDKTTLLAAIAHHFPQHLQMCKALAEGVQQAATAPTTEDQAARKIKRLRTPAQDFLMDDLFESSRTHLFPARS